MILYLIFFVIFQLANCKDEWSSIGKKDIYINGTVGPYWDLDKFCFKLDNRSTPLSINTEAEQNFINEMITDINHEAALNDPQSDANVTTDVLVWIGLEYHRYSNESVYSWRDDSSVKLRKFENDRIHTPDDCFSMSTTTGQWTAADNCSEQYLYACSKPKTYTEVLAQPKKCDKDWINFENKKCFKITGEFGNYSKAKQKCRELKATLPSVYNFRENYFLEEMFRAWKKDHRAGMVWLGMKGYNKWSWPDGNLVFTNFRDGDVKPVNGTLNCGRMVLITDWHYGEWIVGNGEVCDQLVHLITCQKRIT